MAIVLFFCFRSAVKTGSIRLQREADAYETQLGEWLAEQKSILYMITNLISSEPGLMADYPSAVHLLSDIAGHYPEISAC